MFIVSLLHWNCRLELILEFIHHYILAVTRTLFQYKEYLYIIWSMSSNHFLQKSILILIESLLHWNLTLFMVSTLSPLAAAAVVLCYLNKGVPSIIIALKQEPGVDTWIHPLLNFGCNQGPVPLKRISVYYMINTMQPVPIEIYIEISIE